MNATPTFNPIMTGIATKFMEDARSFIGRRIFPVFYSGLQSASYYVFNRVNMLDFPVDIGRAPGAAYSQSQMKISGDAFSCKDYGHAVPIDDAERKKYATFFDADSSATRRAMNVVMKNHEIRVRDKIYNGGVPNSGLLVKWDDYANSNPAVDVDAAKEAVRKQIGLEVNMITVNRDVFNKLKRHPKLIELIKYTQTGILTEDLLAAVFGVPAGNFVVAGTLQNNAAEGQTEDPNNIWSKHMILAHVEEAQDLQAPNFGRTFNWSAMTGNAEVAVDSYRIPDRYSDFHAAKHFVDEKLVGPEAGYILTDVIN